MGEGGQPVGTREPSRRAAITGFGAVLIAAPGGASATMEEMREAMRNALGGGEIREGRVHLDIPPIVENGNSVQLGIRIDSPMMAEDHVTAIHVLSPENPLPNVSRFRLGPRCGKAEINLSIRLATTQSIHVVAVMSDGSRWLGVTPEVEVTTAACFDPT
jgi:sulfur-oxidizing protein SoxY